MRNNRYRLKPHEIEVLKKLRSEEVRNVLIIGDLHEPFCLDEYINFCYNTYLKYNCNQVIFIGDILDNHAFSYHEPDPDGMSAGLELEKTIEKVRNFMQQLMSDGITDEYKLKDAAETRFRFTEEDSYVYDEAWTYVKEEGDKEDNSEKYMSKKL